MSALYFDARIDGSKLQRDINNINRQLNGMTNKFEKEGRKIDEIGSRIGTALAGAFSVYAAGNFVRNIAQVRGEFQQLEVAFETMLASKEKADKLMAQVVDFAATTPFQLTEVAGATKQLLAYGIAAEDILPTLKSLGDVSAGLSVPIERLILNYGQVRTQLKLTGRELRDFNVAGVPIVAELAKNLDVAESKVQDMVSAGEIGFEEVEQAFRTMTQEGGKFNNLMDKQSKTITGLASNFQDAFDKMLNSIGESNEGIITNSIKGAITLTENYEQVIDVLKVLIATYGAYKAAVIAAAVARRAAAWGESIRLIAMYRKELGLATATQQAFNVASKANPYGLILAGISALVTAFAVFRKETETIQDHIDGLNKTIESIGTRVEINSLISKYDDLSRETELTKDEQEELNEAIKEIGDIFPQAITEIDDFGNAIELSREKLENLNRQLRDNARQVAQDEIGESQERLNELLQKQQDLIYANRKGLLMRGSPDARFFLESGFNESDLAEQRKELDLVSGEISKLQGKISELKEGVQDIDKVNAEVALKPYQKLFGDVRSYSQQQALDIKTDLVELLTAGLGSEANIRIKEEIDKISTFIGEETIEEKVNQAVADLKQAKADLESLRAPGAKSSAEDIKTKQEEIKELEEYIELYTGVKVEGDEKIAEQERKALQERLAAKRDYADAEIALEREIQSSRIAIISEGYEKQKAEAELAYKQELDQINEQQQAYLEAYNAKLGYEPTDQGYITELPAEQMARFDELRVNAEREKAQAIEAIERETAREKQQIWDEATESFISNTEREIKAINEKYDKLRERAIETGETDLRALENARERERQEVYINAEMQRLDFQEQIEMQRAEIATQGFNKEVEIERKKLQIVKDIAQKKIDVLKKSSQEESAQEITQLELLIDASDQGLKELNEKTLTDSIDKITRMVDEFQKLTDEIFGADTVLSDMLGGLTGVGESLARIASGDYSGAISLITSIFSMMDNSDRVEKRLAEPWEEFERWIAASNRELQRYIDLRDSAIGYERYESSNQAIEQIIQNIQEAENELSKLSLSFSLEGSGWFNKANREVADQVKELEKMLGGELNLESYRETGAFFWEKVKAIYSFDLNDLLIQDGDFTIEKINELIDEGAITDQKVIEAVNYYEELITDLEAAERQKQELLTATMADNIADGIIDGFEQGYDSAADFAESFEQLMKNAVLNAVKIQALEEPLREWYRQFAAASESDDVLTAEEVSQLEESYNQIIEAARQRFDEMKRISGLNFDADGVGQEGLTGAIKGITEETAGLIAGQFFAFRELQSRTYFTAVEQLDGINQSVIHLAEIAANTRHNSKLNDIDDKLSDLNNHLKDAI